MTSDGKINSNIEERYNKGIGIVNQILGYLNEISFGEYFFEMAVLFRQSMLLNSILCNVEVLYGLKKTHIETLEAVDKLFWRKVFQCPVTTPSEVFFLETNTIPVRHVVMARRLMYYWNILQMDDTELVKKVFIAQKISPCKDDWIHQICEDLSECGISLTEDEIKKMKKYSFSKLVNERTKDVSVKYLLSLKMKNNQQKSKSKNIWPSESMKEYLKTSQISTEDKRLLFSMRCRVNDLKSNYKSKYQNNMKCSLCSSNEEESEVHLLRCDNIITEQDVKHDINEVEYLDIFSDLKKQIRAVKLWKRIFRIRKWKMENRKLSNDGHQVHHLSASYAGNSTVTVDASPLDGDSSTTLQSQLLYVYDFGT